MLRFCNKFRNGYTLAEMLVVMAIFSLMMIALPPLTKKMFKVDTMLKTHGRLECYFNSAGELIQYETYEKGKTVYTKRTQSESIDINGTNVTRKYCEFIPPSNSIYTMIHAVGGGGAGYSVANSFNTSQIPTSEIEAFSYLYYGVVSLWPDWFRYLMNNDKSKLGFENEKFETLKTFKTVDLPYGQAGEAGKKISMFYPRLRGVTIKMYPGVGGVVGNGSNANGGDGTPTVIAFSYTGGDTTYLTVDGGLGGSARGKYGAALVGGDPTDFGVSKLGAVKMQESGFDTVVEDSGVENNHETRINIRDGVIKGHAADWGVDNNNAGWGGNGSYYFVSKGLGSDYDGFFSYLVNNYNEIPTGDGEVARNDHWRLVTPYIGTSFYKRYNETARCQSESGKISIIAQCLPDSANLDTLYKCSLDSIEKVQGSGNVTYSLTVKTTDAGTVISGDHPGYSKCELVEFKNYIKCTSSSKLSGAKHVCSNNVGKDASNFKCIGISNNNRNGHLCKASNGGNGAVIILW